MKKLIFICVVFGLIISSCNNKNSSLDNNKESGYLDSIIVSDFSDKDAVVSSEAEGSLIHVANMHVPRAAHTATLLKNGTVLITGGFTGNDSNVISSVEIYNPSSKSFTKINDLSTSRVSHTATLLPNGKVLIIGGYNGNSLSTTEIYDPELKSFSLGPNLHTARYGHTATLLNDNKILIAGGVGTGWTFLASAEVYDIETSKFMPANSMKFARESHTATLLNNGNVLITGGHRDRRENLKVYSNAEIFDSKTNQFSATADMNTARHKHDAVLLSDGNVLINGGADKKDSLYNSAEIYDPKTSQFTTISNMNYPRFKHNGTSILLPDNNVLIGGGADKAEIYNFETRKFKQLQGNLGTTRLFSCATLFDNGEVLITGGYNDRIQSSSDARLFVKKKR